MSMRPMWNEAPLPNRSRDSSLLTCVVMRGAGSPGYVVIPSMMSWLRSMNRVMAPASPMLVGPPSPTGNADVAVRRQTGASSWRRGSCAGGWLSHRSARRSSRCDRHAGSSHRLCCCSGSSSRSYSSPSVPSWTVPRAVRRAHPAVADDRADVDADAEQLAVPFGEHALEAAGVGVGVVRRQRVALHPPGRLDSGDRAERGREIDEADGRCARPWARCVRTALVATPAVRASARRRGTAP